MLQESGSDRNIGRREFFKIIGKAANNILDAAIVLSSGYMFVRYRMSKDPLRRKKELLELILDKSVIFVDYTTMKFRLVELDEKEKEKRRRTGHEWRYDMMYEVYTDKGKYVYPKSNSRIIYVPEGSGNIYITLGYPSLENARKYQDFARRILVPRKILGVKLIDSGDDKKMELSDYVEDGAEKIMLDKFSKMYIYPDEETSYESLTKPDLNTFLVSVAGFYVQSASMAKKRGADAFSLSGMHVSKISWSEKEEWEEESYKCDVIVRGTVRYYKRAER